MLQVIVFLTNFAHHDPGKEAVEGCDSYQPILISPLGKNAAIFPPINGKVSFFNFIVLGLV